MCKVEVLEYVDTEVKQLEGSTCSTNKNKQTKKHSAQLHLGKKNRNIFGNIKTNLASKARTNIR